MVGRTVQVVAEEIVFRALLPVAIGWIASAIVFAVIHRTQGRETVVAALLMAGLLSWLYVASGTLWWPIAAHGAVNLYAVRRSMYEVIRATRRTG